MHYRINDDGFFKTVSRAIKLGWVVWLLMTVSWINCIINLTKCDFEALYKEKTMYFIGTIIPPAGAIINLVY